MLRRGYDDIAGGGAIELKGACEVDIEDGIALGLKSGSPVGLVAVDLEAITG